MRHWGLVALAVALAGCTSQMPPVSIADIQQAHVSTDVPAPTSAPAEASSAPVATEAMTPSPTPTAPPREELPAPDLARLIPSRPPMPTPIPLEDCEATADEAEAATRKIFEGGRQRLIDDAAARGLPAFTADYDMRMGISISEARNRALVSCGQRNASTETANLMLLAAIAEQAKKDADLAASFAVFAEINGADVMAQDGTFLGFIGSPYSAESIFNTLGNHGSQFGRESIWNEFSEYGSQFGQYSAFNSMSSKPPVITKNGRSICYLTTNTFVSPAISPSLLVQVMLGK